MKKGLLSLLAVALTVVSCQNYDDQFESLTDQITQLSTTVAGLTAITDQVTALQQTVNGLATASALSALAGVVDSNSVAITTNAATAAETAAANAAIAAADAAAAIAAADAATAAANAANATAASGTASATAAANAANATAAIAVANAAAAIAAADAAAAAADAATAAANVANATAAAGTASATAAADAATAAANAANATAAAGTASATAAADAATAAVGTVADQVASVQASITAILADLENVATSADLAAVSATLAIVQADVEEILAGNAVVNQNILINNSATLDYVQTVIGTDADDPNVIVNGTVTIDVVTNEFTAAEIAEVNLITNKIATSLQAVTLTTTSAKPVNFNNLGFVDGALNVTGSTNLADGDSSNDILRTVSGAFTIVGGAGGLDLSLLSSSGAITIDGATLTSVNLGNATAPSVSTSALPAGHMSFPLATSVNTGGASVISLNAALASDIDVKAGTSSLTISAPNAATIDIAGTTLASLTISTVATPAVIHADNVTSITEANIGNAAEFHIGAVTTMGTSTIAAAVVDVSALAAQTGALTFSAATAFTAPLTTSSLTLTAATVISLKSSSQAKIAAPAATSLTLTAQDKVTSFTAGQVQFPALVTLNITGVAHATPLSQANDIIVTSTVLKSLTVAGTNNDVTINTASALTTLDVSGFLNALVVNNSDALVSATLDHDHLEGADASYLTVTGNALLTGVTAPNLQEIGDITIADNAALATLALAAPTSFPVAGSYTISITNNKLTGTYVNATAQSTTTAYVDTIVKSDDLLSIKQFIDAVTGSATYTYHMEVDAVTVSSATLSMTAAIVADADSTTMSATIGSDVGINTAAELANIVAE